MRRFAAIGLLSLATFAQGTEPTFGPEWTFTNQDLIAAYEQTRRITNDQSRAAIARIYEELLREQGDKRRKGERKLAVVESRNKNGRPSVFVSYPDGYWFELSLDAEVVEVSAKPTTLAEWLAIKERVKSDLFDFLARLRLRPNRSEGGGHLNIGIESAFGGDLVALVNFVTDQLQSPFLYFLSRDGYQWTRGHSANPLFASYPSAHHKAYQDVLQKVASGEITDYSRFAAAMRRSVFTYNPENWGAFKNAQLGLGSVFRVKPENRRIELRYFAAQRLDDQFDDITPLYRLLAGRIAFLKQRRRLIAYDPSMRLSLDNKRDSLRFLYSWIHEAGMEPSELAHIFAPRDVDHLAPEDWSHTYPWPEHLSCQHLARQQLYAP